MADLTDLQAAQTVKIAGASPSTGVESNFMQVDSNGSAQHTVRDATSGTAAKVDTLQNLYVAAAPLDSFKATYSAAITNLAAATTPTDVFTLTGSGTKVIRVTRIGVCGTQTTSAVRDIQIIKRSTANSGGTSTTITGVPHDSASAGATATVRAYTVNPTSLGNLVGVMRTINLDVEATNLVGASDHIEVMFGDSPSQAVVVRGTSEVLSVNLNGVTSNGNSWNLYIEWTEE